MTITSFSFFVFCIFAVVAYYIMPVRLRWTVLLVFSISFYFLCSTPYTIAYLLISVLSVYLATNCFQRVRNKGGFDSGQAPKNMRGIFTVTLLINIGLLVVLKYLNFIIFNVNEIKSLLGSKNYISSVDWIASLGISYYTLQMVGYLCDVYWGKIEPQKNICKLLLFGSYFPQMISGPISRYDQVSEQLFNGNKVSYQRITFGIQRMLWGLFKKLVIAGRLGQFVNVVYDNPHNYSALYIWIATFAFALQLYTDFSGGMDIVMGVSECFGIYLPENFNSPFLSKSIQEFWRRWHITLGAWLRDYIMYPILKAQFSVSLGDKLKKWFGKKCGKRYISYFGMLFVWLAMGMWHGSGWKYIVGEGLWYWLIISISNECEPLFKKIINTLHINTECFSYRLFQSLRTFIVFSIGMIFFRAVSLKEAFRLISLSFTMDKVTAMQPIIGIGLDARNWFICLLGLVAVLIVDVLHNKKSVRGIIAEQNLVFRWFIYLLLIFCVLLWGQYGPGYSASEFIYQGF